MRFARTASVLAILSTLGAMALAGLGLEPAEARPAASVRVSPSSGPPGSGFTITFSNFTRDCVIQFLWDDQPLASTPWQSRGTVRVAVPGTAGPGSHLVRGQACESTASASFLVVPAPRPTTTAPVPPTTSGPSTSSTEPTDTGITTPTGGATTIGTTSPGLRLLTFDKPLVQAGEPLSATGTGCDPNAPVTLTANGERVGAATADPYGEFITTVEFTRLRSGRQFVTATCGDVVLSGSVELDLSTSANGSTGVLVVLVLVLLAGITLFAHYRTKDRW